jgi:hypothetical protein
VNLLQKTQNPKDRADIEKALVAISGRTGAACVPCLLPLMHNSDPALRTIGLRVLVIAGGPVALATVKSALEDKDETVQDEAARRLSAWPTNWPGDTAAAEALLSLAKSGKNMLHQVLGLRGYLEYVRGDKQLNNSGKVAKVNELLPLIQRPEEKRLAISVVGAIKPPAHWVADNARVRPGMTEDACSPSSTSAAGHAGRDQSNARKPFRWWSRSRRTTPRGRGPRTCSRVSAEDPQPRIPKGCSVGANDYSPVPAGRVLLVALVAADHYNLPFIVGSHWFTLRDIDNEKRHANRGSTDPTTSPGSN